VTAAASLDQHVRDIIAWHFSPDTGCPFWLDYAKRADWNPLADVQSFADLMRFEHFDDEAMRNQPHDVWIPKAYEGKPFKIFETGGTTGMPKQLISWDDHLIDYTEFSNALDVEYPNAFPHGGNWLMLGPTGPRRLRLAIEHLANTRGGSCYHVDLDPRWVKRLLAAGRYDVANEYRDHVIDQAVPILKNRDVSCLFTTPKLLEALGDKMDVADAGIKGVFCGGTSMTPQVIRFLIEEILDNQAALVPTYGNTLMGLARPDPVGPHNDYQLTYYAPQPRAVLRVVDPDNTQRTVDYGSWGRVELTTLTNEFFMPRFLERDEAIRREPTKHFAWDGVGEVRPFGMASKPTVEGVY
jgi:phenylacetate-coenzyme A ligase PaaK-like adenylate-forming protein